MKTFTRTIEDFTCEHCGTFNAGDGYTNHCFKCLWSKHVDNNPGDRKSECQGLMEPIDVEQKDSEFIIIHKCVSCGHTKKNKTRPKDNFDLVVKISQSK